MTTFGSERIRDALRGGEPLVALETAVLTHGLPRPHSLQVIDRMQEAVRRSGAVPAAVGLVGGRLVVGMTDEQLTRLASDEAPVKVTSRDLSWAMERGLSGGTTVAATIAACTLAGVRVLATGGIGGVHRGWTGRPDISADLQELSRSQVCVVASGAKAILDIPATLELLESLSVLVAGWRTDHFPLFYSSGSDAFPVPVRFEEAAEVARVCRRRWQGLRQPGAVLLCNTVPSAHAVTHEAIEGVINAAIADAASRNIAGPALTPYLLDAVAKLTQGESMEANLSLLEANAELAGTIACSM